MVNSFCKYQLSVLNTLSGFCWLGKWRRMVNFGCKGVIPGYGLRFTYLNIWYHSYRSSSWSLNCGYQYLQCIFSPSELTMYDFWSSFWSWDCSDEAAITTNTSELLQIIIISNHDHLFTNHSWLRPPATIHQWGTNSSDLREQEYIRFTRVDSVVAEQNKICLTRFARKYIFLRRRSFIKYIEVPRNCPASYSASHQISRL